jgi:hypothetical protein
MDDFFDYIIRIFLILLHVWFSVQTLSELEPNQKEPELWFRFGVWGSTLDWTQSPVQGSEKYSMNWTELDIPFTSSDCSPLPPDTVLCLYVCSIHQ